MTSVITPRISLAADPAQPRRPSDLDLEVYAFSAAIVRQRALDPLLTEMVRLRCARVHDCRLCQSLRTDAALDAGLDREMDGKIDFYEGSDLDERTKVALRFTDAMIMTPGQVSAELRDQVREQFTDAEVAELAFDIVKWSQQKVLVSLRIEAPPREGLTLMSFDDQGGVSFGGAV